MERRNARNRGKKGFTLVELVVVIAVLAILAGVGVVAYNGYIAYARKGIDKKTVGEVMHALELADYNDPSLFGENGGAMVVLTTDGYKVAGGLEGADLDGALMKAFGDKNAIKLNYDKWGGAADMSVFANLGDEGTKVAEYLDYDTTASFAGDIDTLWSDVQKVFDSLNIPDENARVKMAQAVNWSTYTSPVTVTENSVTKTYNGGNVEYILDTWKNQGHFTNTSSGSGGFYLAAAHSRNYSFYMYAKNHCDTWDDTMQSQIDELLKNFGSVDYFDKQNGMYSLTDPRWADIVSAYNAVDSVSGHSQAEADAMAYLGMMEAAKAVGDDENLDMRTGNNGLVRDEDYLEAFKSYVGMVGNILGKTVDFNAIKTLAGQVGSGKSPVVINVVKSNGTLTFKISPEEANPRTENGNGASTEEEEVVYTQDGATLDFGSGVTTGEIVMKPKSEITVTITDLPGSDSKVQGYNTTYGGNVTSATSDQANKTVTITTGDAGSGTVTITWKVKASVVEIPGIFTLNVLIK